MEELEAKLSPHTKAPPGTKPITFDGHFIKKYENSVVKISLLDEKLLQMRTEECLVTC